MRIFLLPTWKFSGHSLSVSNIIHTHQPICAVQYFMIQAIPIRAAVPAHSYVITCRSIVTINIIIGDSKRLVAYGWL